MQIGFAAKIVILCDISKILVYLHKCNILNHNLTAHDILLLPFLRTASDQKLDGGETWEGEDTVR